MIPLALHCLLVLERCVSLNSGKPRLLYCSFLRLSPSSFNLPLENSRSITQLILGQYRIYGNSMHMYRIQILLRKCLPLYPIRSRCCGNPLKNHYYFPAGCIRVSHLFTITCSACHSVSLGILLHNFPAGYGRNF